MNHEWNWLPATKLLLALCLAVLAAPHARAQSVSSLAWACGDQAWACDDASGYQWNIYGANPALVADVLTAKWKSRFVVAAIASGNRPVYLRNADGTRGPRVVMGDVPQSIASGQPCDGRRRLIGTTTRYHAVSGLLSLTGVVLPADSFTACTKTDAPAAGWPP